VDAGICADVTEVFQRYLTEGKPGFVPQRWAGLAEAVRWITAAGGVAVIAHPAATLWAARRSMRCFPNSRTAAARAWKSPAAATPPQKPCATPNGPRIRLAASRGSDFHSPAESRIALGTLPALPRRLNPVWELLADRIQPAPPRALTPGTATRKPAPWPSTSKSTR
jgi:predicted metal-dependent phosphoesterase TrpH